MTANDQHEQQQCQPADNSCTSRRTCMARIEHSIAPYLTQSPGQQQRGKKFAECIIEAKVHSQSFSVSTYLAYFVTELKLFHHYTQSTSGYIIAGIHTRVCRCYNRHVMSSITRIFTWIPHRKSKFILLYWAQHHRIGPTPLCINPKKA